MAFLKVLHMLIEGFGIRPTLILLADPGLRSLIQVTLKSVALILQHVQRIELLQHLH